MCRFTRIFWTQCGHHTLSTLPLHTELCPTALDTDDELHQGYDKAPAACHPLPEDVEELGTQYRSSDRIAQTNCLFTHCEACVLALGLSAAPRGAGIDVEAPVEEFGVYTEEDGVDVGRWRGVLMEGVAKSEAAVRGFEEFLTTDNGGVGLAAVQRIRDEIVQRALVDGESPERAGLFRRTYQEVDRLLLIAETYILIRMPRSFVNDLLKVVQMKLSQADLRLEIFVVLTSLIASHTTPSSGNEAALNLHADKLAARLGNPAVPDAETFSHLTAEAPQHVLATLATAERVRSLSTVAHASIPRTLPYAPRSTFGAGKNTNALAIDIERAWNRALDRMGDMPVLRQLGENVEVVYDAALDASASAHLGRMGVGRWGEEERLAQRDTLGQGGESDESDETLVGSPERLGSLPGPKEQTVGKEATFMGMPLEDSDDEVGEGEGIDPGQEVDGKAANRQSSVQTDDGNPGRQRDDEVGDVKDSNPEEEVDGQAANSQSSVQTNNSNPGRQPDKTGLFTNKRKTLCVNIQVSPWIRLQLKRTSYVPSPRVQSLPYLTVKCGQTNPISSLPFSSCCEPTLTPQTVARTARRVDPSPKN